MDGAKIQLSEDEKGLISNADLILTKNRILVKVNQLLTGLMARQASWLETSRERFEPALVRASPKISRGENYLGLPWLMLDQPRHFTRDDSCAIRCFFWWGNFFSITLQLSGASHRLYAGRLAGAWKEFSERGYLAGIADDPWVHHAGRDNYIPVNEMDREDFSRRVNTHGFVKLMLVIPLSDWDTAGETMAGEFRFLMGLLAN